ncbi:MAG: PAS domain S-box protein, partial [Opitutaceae bacterium]
MKNSPAANPSRSSMPDALQVLHVDGDAAERRALGQLVRERGLGWTIFPAATASEARARLATAGAVDVIVTDLRLPDGETFELFPDPASLGGRAAIMVTGQGDEESAARALRTGFSDYLVKRPGHAHLGDLPARIEAAVGARRAERGLRDTAAKLSDLFDGTSEIIQSVDPQGRIEYVNRRWRETFGYRDDEIAGINLFSLIHPDEQAHCGMLFQRLMAGEDIGEIETRFVARDGRSVTLRGRATVHFEQGRPIATRTVLRDVTEERRQEEIGRRRQDRVLRLQANLLQLRERSETELGAYLHLVTGSTLASVGLSVSAIGTLSPCGSRLECRSRHRAGAAEPDEARAGATTAIAGPMAMLA